MAMLSNYSPVSNKLFPLLCKSLSKIKINQPKNILIYSRIFQIQMLAETLNELKCLLLKHSTNSNVYYLPSKGKTKHVGTKSSGYLSQHLRVYSPFGNTCSRTWPGYLYGSSTPFKTQCIQIKSISHFKSGQSLKRLMAAQRTFEIKNQSSCRSDAPLAVTTTAMLSLLFSLTTRRLELFFWARTPFFQFIRFASERKLCSLTESFSKKFGGVFPGKRISMHNSNIFGGRDCDHLDSKFGGTSSGKNHGN